MSVADAVENAKEPSKDDINDHNIKIVESGLEIVADNIEAGLSTEVLTALAELRANGCPKFMMLRQQFKKADADIRMGDLDRMINSAMPEPMQKDDSQPGAVENIVAMVQELGDLFSGTDDEPYIRFVQDQHFETWALQSTVFKEWVSHEYYKSHGRAPKAQQLADAFTTLAGCARHEGETHEVHLRVAADSNGYLLDVGDDQWSAIRVSAAGCEALAQSPVRFRRPKGTQSLFEPDKSGTLEDLMSLVNIRDEDQALFVAAMCEFLRPDTAYPVIEIGGEQGAGKSMTQKHIRRLFDPKDVSLRAEPKNVTDIFIAARNNHIISYNNLSHLQTDYQDALCCLATGGGFATRRLYSDGDEATFDAKRPVIMNGIVSLATQPDLLSRVVKFDCPRVAKRLSDSELEQTLEERGPKALGFVLTTFCKALALLPNITIDKPPRMMDFALLGEAVAIVMGGKSGDFMDRYNSALDAAAEQSIEGVPVIEALTQFVKRKGAVENTVGKLFDELTGQCGSRKPSAWPRTSRGFRESLKRYEPAMRLMGFEIEYPSERRAGQKIKVSFSPQHNSLAKQPSQSSQPSQKHPMREGCEHGEGEMSKEICWKKKKCSKPSTLTSVDQVRDITPDVAQSQPAETGTEGIF
ncbi:MAG: hypothetical protein ACI9XK_002261 [Granulosicoccus sp.]|jgi:hypothetical protein